jgi:hypothetical protein
MVPLLFLPITHELYDTNVFYEDGLFVHIHDIVYDSDVDGSICIRCASSGPDVAVVTHVTKIQLCRCVIDHSACEMGSCLSMNEGVIRGVKGNAIGI